MRMMRVLVMVLFALPCVVRAGSLDYTGLNQLTASFGDNNAVKVNLAGFGVVSFILPEEELVEFAHHLGKELLELKPGGVMEYTYEEGPFSVEPGE